jgi:hypothetical protein
MGSFFNMLSFWVLFKYAVSTASVLYDFFSLFPFFVALRVVSDLFFCAVFNSSRHSFTFMLRYLSNFFFCREYLACSFVHLFICYTQPHQHSYILAASVSSEFSQLKHT